MFLFRMQAAVGTFYDDPTSDQSPDMAESELDPQLEPTLSRSPDGSTSKSQPVQERGLVVWQHLKSCRLLFP